jgi:hypothetical protein
VQELEVEQDRLRQEELRSRLAHEATQQHTATLSSQTSEEAMERQRIFEDVE